jgi:aminopeptidase N
MKKAPRSSACYRKATDLYFARHDGQAATVEEWVKCFEDACGRDLKQFRLWYQQSGTPEIEARGDHDPARKTYTVTLKQNLGPTPGQPTKKPMHMPIRLGLLGESGRALSLTLDSENAVGPEERVLELTGSEQQFLFVNIDEPPLISVGRRFSVPAKFDIPMSRRERATLMARDGDAFNRWEAGQTLAREVMLDMAEAVRSGGAVSADPAVVGAMGDVLARAGEDRALAALMLMPPLESELALVMQPADPEAIHTARCAFVRAIADAHRGQFQGLYESLDSDAAYSPDAESAGRRALRNTCLRYLTAADDEDAARLADAHYRAASNMTDMVAGLSQLVRMNSRHREQALAHFHDRFRNDALVLDKWLALQAASPLPGTVDGVRALMRHPFFDIRNPNRVRALIGAFSANHLRFHGSDGKGYALVGETLRTLDGINPQVAARMAGAFENWRRYDTRRQQLMRAELEAMLAMPARSSNLFEVATKMLG